MNNSIKFFSKCQPIKTFFRAFKYSWQRITKGYCDIDVWNIDYWFLGIMPNMLQELRDKHWGTPIFVDDKESDLEPKERWNTILDAMIFMFREADEDTCGRLNPCQKEWEDLAQADFNTRETYEYKNIRNKYIEEEKKLSEYRDLCKNEGLDLFKKWFWELWD